jgi:hypothetical protein
VGPHSHRAGGRLVWGPGGGNEAQSLHLQDHTPHPLLLESGDLVLVTQAGIQGLDGRLPQDRPFFLEKVHPSLLHLGIQMAVDFPNLLVHPQKHLTNVA